MKSTLYKITILFFLVCICLTILSRGAYNLTLASVETTSIQNAVLDYSIKGDGTIRKKGQEPVFMEENLLIKKIQVNLGQKVNINDELAQVDIAELDKLIAEQERQINILDIQISDINTNNSINNQNKENAIEAAQNEYERVYNKVQNSIGVAEADMNNAYTDYENYIASIDTFTDGESEQEGEAERLYADYESKVEAYNAMVNTGDEEIQNALRDLNNLNQIENVDSSAKSLEVQKEELIQNKTTLLSLKEKDGKILAPISGIIRKINIVLGGISTKDAIMIIDNLKSESQMEVDLEVNSRNYIKNGDKVSVQGKNQNGEIVNDENAEIVSIDEDMEKNILKVIIKINNMEFSYGTSASFTKIIKSQPYSDCLPLSCLREASNRYFVYAVEKENSILGRQDIVKKVYVDIFEKDGTYVALKEGALTSDALIVVKSNKNLEDGNRVKLLERNKEDEGTQN